MRRIAIVGALASIGAALILAAPAQAHVAFCTETVNPHGQNVPPAGSTTLPGPKGGINDDGFYEVGNNVGTSVILQDTDGNVFGVFASGTKVKYTEANGAEPSVKKMAATTVKQARSISTSPVPATSWWSGRMALRRPVPFRRHRSRRTTRPEGGRWGPPGRP